VTTRVKPKRNRLPWLLVVAVALAGSVFWGCGDGDDEGAASTNGEADAPTAEALATRTAQDLPVLSSELLAGWSEEGEPGKKLSEACLTSGGRPIFTEKSSRLLLGPGGEQARSGTVLFSEQGDGPSYAQELFADAQTCVQELLESWLGKSGEPAVLDSADQIGDGSITLIDGTTSTGAVFFRRDTAVVAVVVAGADEAELSELAGMLDEAIVSREGGWEVVPETE